MPPSPLKPGEILRLLEKHFSPRARRVWFTQGRAHVELRSGDSPELEAVAERLRAATEQFGDLLWAEVHQATGRAVLAYRPGTLSEADIVAIVVEAEVQAGLGRAMFEGADHPADLEPSELLLIEILAEAIAMLLAGFLRLTIIPQSRLASAALARSTWCEQLPVCGGRSTSVWASIAQICSWRPSSRFCRRLRSAR